MEVVRKIINASQLMSIIPLPDSLKNRKLEIIILPAEEKVTERHTSQIDEIVDSLVGIIPNNGMDLEDYRAERLNKYEVVD